MGKKQERGPKKAVADAVVPGKKPEIKKTVEATKKFNKSKVEKQKKKFSPKKVVLPKEGQVVPKAETAVPVKNPEIKKTMEVPKKFNKSKVEKQKKKFSPEKVVLPKEEPVVPVKPETKAENVSKKSKKNKQKTTKETHDSEEVEVPAEKPESKVPEDLDFPVEKDGFVTDSESEDETPKPKTEPKKPKKPQSTVETIFVGNLPINTKKAQILKFFEPFGKVKSIRLRAQDGKTIFKKSQIKNDPFINAFVVFEDAKTAQGAMENCPRTFKERKIRVTSTAEKQSATYKRSIFVGNLAYATLDEDLYEIFETCGEIDYVRTIRGKSGCQGFAYVCFKEKSALALAMELQGTRLKDRPIRLEKCRDETKQKKKDDKKEGKNAKHEVVHKMINGRHVTAKKPKVDTNRDNALKRLQKKPGAVGKDAPSGRGRSTAGPRGRGGVAGPRGRGGVPAHGKDDKRKFNPKLKNKKPRMPHNIKLAKQLNVNWSKANIYKRKNNNPGAGAVANKTQSAK